MADEKIVSDERLHDYLRTYVKTLKLTNPKFLITEGTNVGDNYVSLVCRVTIEGMENGEVKKIELVLKTTRSCTNEVMSSSKVTKLFEREVFFYWEVWPIFKETLKERGGIVDRFPVLYDVNVDPGKEIMMLENLKPQGFVMAKSKVMDYPHLSLALRCLGEFHACSFITRYANPTSFEKLKRMEEPAFHSSVNSENEDMFKSIQKGLTDVVLKALENEDKHYLERYQQFANNMNQTMVEVTNGAAAEPYAVVNHGDSWTNNMLFKYDQEKNPYDLRFLDLQISRYASPVLDILYVVFCCCTQETRSKYFDQLIQEYYETLSECIKKAGYDPNILFPYEALSQHFTKFGKYAAGMATYTIHVFTTEGVELRNTYDSEMLQERLKNDSFYRSMLLGTFKDIIDRNYI